MSRTMKDSGIPWIGDIPSHWVVMPHKWVMHKEKEIREKYHDETILSLTMRGVIVRDLDAGGKMPSSFDGYQAVYPNDLLQCLFDIDVTPRCVGLVKNEGLVSPAYSRFVLHSNGYTPFFDYLLRYMDDNKVLLHLSKNLRSSLTETDFGAINTCVPPLPEQQSIADFLDKKCSEIDEMLSLQEKIVEELKAYKQSVITEAVTKGLNPNAPMKDSGIEWIGQIPKEWRIGRVKNYFTRKNKKAHQENPIILSLTRSGVRIRDISKNEGQIAESYYDYNPVERDDLLLNPMDLYSGANCSISNVEGVISPAYVNLRFLNGANPRYYDYYFKTQYWAMAFFAHGKGVSFDNRWTLGIDTLMNYSIPIPPFEEQQAIADYLDAKCSEIDALISLKQSKIETLKEYKKSIIYEYITGKKELSL